MSEILFHDEKSLAEFVAAFLETGSTRVFTVVPRSTGGYKLEFTGGF